MIGLGSDNKNKSFPRQMKIVKRILWKSNPRSSPSRSRTEWAMLQLIPEDLANQRNRAPPVRGAICVFVWLIFTSTTTTTPLPPILGYIFGVCVKVYHNEPFHFFTIAVCKIESPRTGKNSCIIKWDECIMSCVTLEYYPTDEYKSDSDFWFFRGQNVKPFIEGKRAAQMFSTEKEKNSKF